MTQKELPDYSAYIVTEYYKNNTKPFLDAFSESCLWIGPAEGQMIHTKTKMLQAFSQENNQLTFGMHDLQIIPIPAGPSCLDVVLTYTIDTYYPDGKIVVFQQRVGLLWVEESITDAAGKISNDYFIRVCHISNEYPYDERDTIYPNHFTELEISRIYTVKTKFCKFALKGPYGSYFYLSGDSILWVESQGTHSLIHAVNGVYESLENITAVVEKYSDFLCKIHASYAVNPAYISEIGRFYVRMDDGKHLNIPEKKYTQTRDTINLRIKSLNR